MEPAVCFRKDMSLLTAMYHFSVQLLNLSAANCILCVGVVAYPCTASPRHTAANEFHYAQFTERRDIEVYLCRIVYIVYADRDKVYK